LAKLLGVIFPPAPPWTKHKLEFEYPLGNLFYIICLQHIENFAYLMEVEFLSNKDDSYIHRANLLKIIKDFGAEPIEPKYFRRRIKDYQKKQGLL